MKLPQTYRPIIASVQHWNTMTVKKCELIRVDETDVDFRFVDDNSELSYDWDVIDWEYK